MAQTIRSSSDDGANGGTPDGRSGGSIRATTSQAPSTVVAAATRAVSGAGRETADRGTAGGAATAGEARPIARARHIVGQLAALPRLARGADARTESVAERIARRRRVAQATLDEEASTAGTDWARVGVFSAGVAIGALIGAGVALLLAPTTGYETRGRLAHRARRAGGRAADWRYDD